jgi:hypothetical protein
MKSSKTWSNGEKEIFTGSFSSIHAYWGAAFYGGFGLLGATRQFWILCAILDPVCNAIGLGTFAPLLLPSEAQDACSLACLPLIALGMYYLRNGNDVAFMESSVYGRLLCGGGGVAAHILAGNLPSGCWLIWICDVLPTLLCWNAIRTFKQASGKRAH